MFEPTPGTADFAADAAAAEQHEDERRYWQQPAAEPAAEAPWAAEDAELRRLEEQLKARKAELARRPAAPQVIDSDGREVETRDSIWAGPLTTIELQGKKVEVKLPTPAAIQYLSLFGFGDAGARRGDFQDFMHRHVPPDVIAQIKEWTYAGEIDEEFFKQLTQKLVTEGTGRPTEPSSSSPRSR